MRLSQAKAKGHATKGLEAAGADVIDLASDDSAEGAPLGRRRSCEPKRLIRLPAMSKQAHHRCANLCACHASSLSQQLAAHSCYSHAMLSLLEAPLATTCSRSWVLRCALVSNCEKTPVSRTRYMCRCASMHGWSALHSMSAT